MACVRPRNSDTAGYYDGDNVKLNNLIWTRNGVKFPLDYNIQQRGTESDFVHSNILRDYLNAIRPFTEIDHTIQSPVVANQQAIRADNAVAQDPTMEFVKNKQAGGGGSYGFGVAYDALREGDMRAGGADFKHQQWGFTLESDLGTSTGGDAPISAYIFFLAKNQMAIKNGQIQVVD